MENGTGRIDYTYAYKAGAAGAARQSHTQQQRLGRGWLRLGGKLRLRLGLRLGLRLRLGRRLGARLRLSGPGSVVGSGVLGRSEQPPLEWQPRGERQLAEG